MCYGCCARCCSCIPSQYLARRAMPSGVSCGCLQDGLGQSPVKTQNSTPFSHPASSPVGAFDIINIDRPPRESLISSSSPLQKFTHIPSDYNPDMQRMWTCSDPDASKLGRRKKLIFIHVLRPLGAPFVSSLPSTHCSAMQAMLAQLADLVFRENL